MTGKPTKDMRRTGAPTLLWTLGAVAVCGVVLVGSCDPSKSTPTAASRWSGDPVVTDQPEFKQASELGLRNTQVNWSLPQVSVYSFPKPSPNASAPPGLKDLSDHGQLAYIEALTKGGGKSDIVRNELGKPITETAKQEASEGHDPYRFDRVLVATVIKGTDMLPGDRLLWTRTMVKPVNFQFAGYTVATTKNSSVKIADLEQSLSHKSSGKLEATMPLPGSPKLNVDTGDEGVAKVTSDLTAQFEDVGIDITPDFLRIYRESERGSDVSGNTQIELSMITDPIKIYNNEYKDKHQNFCKKAANDDVALDDLVLVVTSAHLTDGQNVLPSTEASLVVRPQRILPHCPLLARVWTIYEERQILSNRWSYNEGDQRVGLIRGATYPPMSGEPDQQPCNALAPTSGKSENCEPGVIIPVMPADDVSSAVWYIKTQTGAAVKAESGRGPARKLAFTDYMVASDVIHWIKAQDAKNIGPLKLYYDVGLLVPEKCIDGTCPEGDPSGRP